MCTTGTSEFYRGDSAINVVGDLLSCSLGYNFAKAVATKTSVGFYYFPLFLFGLLELALAFAIRDNMTLIVLQLLLPNQRYYCWFAWFFCWRWLICISSLTASNRGKMKSSLPDKASWSTHPKLRLWRDIGETSTTFPSTPSTRPNSKLFVSNFILKHRIRDKLQALTCSTTHSNMLGEAS